LGLEQQETTMQTTTTALPLPFHASPVYPRHPSGLPSDELRTRRYTLRFARDEGDLEAAQALRYRVFNEELNEGLVGSRERGLDCDPYDARCHHLLVVDNASGEVVGTYRVMTRETAYGEPFYSDSEYYLGALPGVIARDAVEAGRACVAAEHRNGRVIRMLFAGLAQYLAWNQKRYLFGCCSVPTLEPTDMYALLARLQGEGHVHTELLLSARPHVRADMPPLASVAARLEQVEPPALMTTYLRLGARVISEPAFDHEFGVSDLLVLLDMHAMAPRVLASLTSVGASRAA
jgi:putative hemolysin